MLFYFVIFCIAGFAIGSILKDSKIAIAAIIVVSFLWALVFGPWALATFAELMLGYLAAKELNHIGTSGDKRKSEPHDNNKSLAELDCRDNKLTHIDVHNNKSLSYFYCLLKELQDLNTGNGNALRELDCSSNQLEVLSVDNFLESIESGRLPSSIKNGEKNIHQAQALEVIQRDDLIAEALDARNVEHIVHFTQAPNVDSIIEYGLLPRNMLHLLPVPAACNDDLRLDFREDATCLSIGYPNYRMFYKYRKIGEENGIKWAVIVLSKDVLIEKDCFFCHTNGASRSVRGLSKNTLKGVEAFNALYEREPTRKELGLPDDWPTDAQAEVLVKGAIEPRYIRSIVYASKLLADEYKLKYPQLDIRCNRYFYNTRDYSLRWMQKWQ